MGQQIALAAEGKQHRGWCEQESSQVTDGNDHTI